MYQGNGKQTSNKPYYKKQCVLPTQIKPVRQEPIQQAAEQMKTLPQAKKTVALCTSMGAAHTESMDPRDYPGLHNSFQDLPQLAQIPAFVYSDVERKALLTEIRKLLEKQAISPSEAINGFEQGSVEVDT